MKLGCFQTVVLEKVLESPLDSKEIKPDNPKRKSTWILIGRTDTETGTPILWPPDIKIQFIRKDPDIGKDWRPKSKGVSEDDIVRQHHRVQWTWIWANSGRQWRTGKTGVSSPGAHKQADTTWWLNRNKQKTKIHTHSAHFQGLPLMNRKALLNCFRS